MTDSASSFLVCQAVPKTDSVCQEWVKIRFKIESRF